MANFQEHLKQAKKNLRFLEGVNSKLGDHVDWQVTVCFYSALHLLNAYLAKEANLHYNKHKDMEQQLNWANTLSLYRLNETDFTTYQQLRNLSRRSRYLCTESGDSNGPAEATREKQLSKAIKHLDNIIKFFLTKYPEESIDVTAVICPTLVGSTLKYFRIKELTAAA